MIKAIIVQNIVLLLLACGMSGGLFYLTGSLHSFWFMLLLIGWSNVEVKEKTGAD